MIKPECETCRFFKVVKTHDYGDDLGECRRYPPKLYETVLANVQGEVEPETVPPPVDLWDSCLWPIVWSNAYCGEYLADE